MRFEVSRRCKFKMTSDAQDSININFKLLSLLINDKMTSLSCSLLPRTENNPDIESITEACSVISDTCPKLVNLFCDAESKDTGHNENSSEISWSEEFFNFSLEVLKIPYIMCNDERLQLLARHLPKLK